MGVGILVLSCSGGSTLGVGVDEFVGVGVDEFVGVGVDVCIGTGGV